MEFTDLKTQYRVLQAEIDARMRRVLEHGQYILGPEVRELEEKLAAHTGANSAPTSLTRPPVDDPHGLALRPLDRPLRAEPHLR